MLELYIWSLFQSTSLFSIYFLLLLCYYDFVTTVVILLNTILISSFIFILSNKLFSHYYVNKIKKPIGLIRFLFYFIFLLLSFWIGYKLVNLLKEPLTLIKNKVVNMTFFQDENYSDEVISQLIKSIIEPVKQISVSILNIGNSIIENIIIKPYIFIIILITIIILLKVVRSIGLEAPLNNSTVKKDFLHAYSKILVYINNMMFKNNLLEAEIIELSRKRDIVSPNFFSMSILTYESSFYLGVFSNLLIHTKSEEIQNLLFIGIIILILINHTFELREEFPHLFLIGSDKNKLLMYKLSGNTTYELYSTKLKLMLIILFIPSIIVGIFIFIMIFNNILFLYGLVILALTFALAPKIQMMATTFVIKTDYTHFGDVGQTEEEKIIRKIQAFPRMIMVVPLLYFLYSLIFIPWSSNLILLFYFVYLTIYILGSLFFFKYSNKMAKRNLLKFDKEFLRL